MEEKARSWYDGEAIERRAVMPSPFPGMNPYLESRFVWNDFHARFMTKAAEHIGRQVAPHYQARIEEYLYIHELPENGKSRLGRADVSVHEDSQRPAGSPVTDSAIATAPTTVGLPPRIDVERISHLEIRDRQSRAVITILELLSPSNKYAGTDRDQYLEKQARILGTMTNLVEIDLLRGGPRMPWEEIPECDYYVAISRGENRTRADFWPIRLRDRLPAIPIPLRGDESQPKLDLQGVLNEIYDSAGYADEVYRREPDPPLSPTDAAWAKEILAGVGAA
jgi:hypothetical protein